MIASLFYGFDSGTNVRVEKDVVHFDALPDIGPGELAVLTTKPTKTHLLESGIVSERVAEAFNVVDFSIAGKIVVENVAMRREVSEGTTVYLFELPPIEVQADEDVTVRVQNRTDAPQRFLATIFGIDK